jgi:ribosomal-protein-alanine N-acetyltransferase
MRVSITPISHEDLDAAADAIASGEIFQQYGFDQEVARETLRNAHGKVVVARLDGAVVGVAIYWTDGLMPAPAYLRILAVKEGVRGKGVGRALLRYIEGEAFQRGPNLFLCCTRTNVLARRFYEREGYQVVGELPDFIQQGIHEVLYRKTRGAIRGYEPDRCPS